MELIAQQDCDACASQLCNVREVVRAACDQLGYTRVETEALILAVDEACANVIRYAYQGRELTQGSGRKEARMALSIYRHVGDCVFHIRDYGEPNPEFAALLNRQQAVGQAINDQDLLTPGGLGLGLISRIMDSVTLVPYTEFSPEGAKGNLLVMRKKLPI